MDEQLEPAAHGLRAPTTTSFAEPFQRGREQFHALGCAGCHRPMMVLESPMLAVEGLPPLDLSREMRQPGLRYDPELGGYPVWLFSDLKRHDMGKANAAQHVQRGVGARRVSHPAPLGRRRLGALPARRACAELDYAIAGHDGEGAAARAAYAALDHHEKGELRVYLMSLRRLSRVVVP
jgi:CxxC motif-containing protein (DUF1111 family)